MFSAAEGPLVDGHVGERERREGQSEAAGLRREARRRVRVVVRWSGLVPSLICVGLLLDLGPLNNPK